MVTRRSILALATAGALSTAAALAFGQTDATTAAAPSAADQPDAHTSFAVFRSAARAGDRMPAAVRAMMAPLAAREGLDLDGARAVAPAGRGYVWAIPASDRVCLAIPDPVDGFGVNCRSTNDALQGRLWVSLVGLPGQAAGDARVAVLVPDGIGSATAVDVHGARHAMAVAENVAFGDVGDSARVEYSDGDGTHGDSVPGTPPALVSSSG